MTAVRSWKKRRKGQEGQELGSQEGSPLPPQAEFQEAEITAEEEGEE